MRDKSTASGRAILGGYADPALRIWRSVLGVGFGIGLAIGIDEWQQACDIDCDSDTDADPEAFDEPARFAGQAKAAASSRGRLMPGP